MAAIPHSFTEQNTQQTTTSATYVNVSGASIASGQFTVGKKYLIVVTAQVSQNTGAANYLFRVLHGSTEFAGSEMGNRNHATPELSVYCFFTVWTAVSGEAIQLQFHRGVDGGIAQADQIALLAIQISDDLIENTDWFYAEDNGSLGLTTTYQDGASITFTPGTASHDWLVMTVSRADLTSAAISAKSRISRSGEASSTLPECVWEVEEASDSLFTNLGLARVFSLGASSNTFKEQAACSSGTAHTRTNSRVFALNLNKFKNHANAYTEGDLGLGTTSFGNLIQTASITPDVAGDVWIGTCWVFDANDTNDLFHTRIQVDNSDQPSGQTTDNYIFHMSRELIDELPFNMTTMPNLSAAAHTIDVDGDVNQTQGTPAARYRSLWALTMELAAAPPPPSIALDNDGVLWQTAPPSGVVQVQL